MQWNLLNFLLQRERKAIRSEKMSGEKENSKVRAFMGQTPKNLKQKFFSVLGTSSEYKKQFISGISNKVSAVCGVVRAFESQISLHNVLVGAEN